MNININKYIKYKSKYLNLLNKYNSTNIKSSNSPPRRIRTLTPPRRIRTPTPPRVRTSPRRDRVLNPSRVRTPSPPRRDIILNPPRVKTPSLPRRDIISSPPRRDRVLNQPRVRTPPRKNIILNSPRVKTPSPPKRDIVLNLPRVRTPSPPKRDIVLNPPSPPRRDIVSTPIVAKIHARQLISQTKLPRELSAESPTQLPIKIQMRTSARSLNKSIPISTQPKINTTLHAEPQTRILPEKELLRIQSLLSSQTLVESPAFQQSSRQQPSEIQSLLPSQAQPSIQTLVESPAFQQSSKQHTLHTYNPNTQNYIPINSPDKDVNVPKSDEIIKNRKDMVNYNRMLAESHRNKLNIIKPTKYSYGSVIKPIATNYDDEIPQPKLTKYSDGSVSSVKDIDIDIDKNLNKAKIVFFKGTTNQAIIYFYNKDNTNKICILNFANPTTVGGTYLDGDMAQEEELCRTIIDLYPSLELLSKNEPSIKNDTNKQYDNFTPETDVFYSSNLSLYNYDGKQSNNKYNRINYNHNEPIKISVITAAAPDLRMKENTKEEEVRILDRLRHTTFNLYNHLSNIITQIYLVPKHEENKINILILGAFGCGAFSPSSYILNKWGYKYNERVAKYFTKILKKKPQILQQYDYICFAIPPNQNNQNNDNYDVFYNKFKTDKAELDITIDEIDEKDII